MTESSIKYEVQELVNMKRWKAVTYPIEEHEARQVYQYMKNNPGNYTLRLVKVETVIQVVEK